MSDHAPTVASHEARHAPARTGLWWRITVVVAVAAVGAFCALACAFAWLFMGFMGTAVEPWEPTVYGGGFLLSVTVPLVIAWWVLRPWRVAAQWVTTGIAVAFVLVALAGVGVLGAS